MSGEGGAAGSRELAPDALTSPNWRTAAEPSRDGELSSDAGGFPTPLTEGRIIEDGQDRHTGEQSTERARTAIPRIGSLLAGALVLASCSGVQSALDPAGEEAAQVAALFWVMAFGGGVIWAAVVALALYAARWKRTSISEAAGARLIFWGGAVFPITVLTALLAFALWLMPSLRPFAGHDGELRQIEVVGSQFWWRVAYVRQDGARVVSANEIRLPVGERVEFVLETTDMIHSFWIPALGGKMDLVPGRTNRLSLRATRTGTYRGQCAEFCGTSHAQMAFPVVVMAVEEFEAWLDARSMASSGIDADPKGRDVFGAEGCGACHRIDGTDAAGTAGPDLSHVGSRLTLGAGLLANESNAMERFIAHSSSVKPGSHMPAYLDLSADDLSRVAGWLEGLK
ncbi:MAG: cytochrome c oxidase subunit II [Rhizobiaceae bacterium]